MRTRTSSSRTRTVSTCAGLLVSRGEFIPNRSPRGPACCVVAGAGTPTPNPVRDVLGRVRLDEEGIEGEVFGDRGSLRRGEYQGYARAVSSNVSCKLQAVCSRTHAEVSDHHIDRHGLQDGDAFLAVGSLEDLKSSPTQHLSHH